MADRTANQDTWVGAGVAAPAGDRLSRGTSVARYLVLECVGSGGMGVVYAAYDPTLDRKIALKLMDGRGAGASASVHAARLLREAQAIARLSHPNVVSVHDVGVVQGQVFMAMELVPGGTLRSWLATGPHRWRDILEVFLQAGRGLAAAHHAGLIHRDFKPDNVLLDKHRRPKVADFGLARVAADAQLQSGAGDPATSATSVEGPPGFTSTGAVLGTPAYMAPEQFLGQVVDARADQFSFCVALYEALYGARPFEGESTPSSSASVRGEPVRPRPDNAAAPAWLWRTLRRGLSRNPEDRFLSMEQLLRALARDPSAVLRRRLAVGTAVAAVVATLVWARQTATHRRDEIQQQAATQLQQSRRHLHEARRRSGASSTLRAQAFAAFDGKDIAQGEQRWREALTETRALDLAFRQALQAAEAALALTPNPELQRHLADILRDWLAAAETAGATPETAGLLNRLSALDPGDPFVRRSRAPGVVLLQVAPASVRLSAQRFADGPDGRRHAIPIDKAFTPGGSAELPAGSYRLHLEAPGRASAFLPFLLKPAQRRVLIASLPSASQVPPGFVYVPAGDFLFGDTDEALRQSFLKTAPLHPLSTDAFLISRTEVTFAAWMEFLAALPAPERRKRTPRSAQYDVTAHIGAVELVNQGQRRWRLRIAPVRHLYSVTTGEPLRYRDRPERAEQRWEQLPVTGVSVQDALAYFGWLDATGRVRGARLCTETEWERAGRGADERIYPHGNVMLASDANQDVTYGRRPNAFGPDEVGSFPASRSPFGVDDLAGNVWEFVASSFAPGEVVLRGGGYYHYKDSARLTNREPFEPTARSVHLGLRICADAPETQREI